MNKRAKNQIMFSIALNSFLLGLELFAFSCVFFRYFPGMKPFKWYHSLTYYTNLSNLFLLFATILTLIQDIREYQGKEIKEGVVTVKFTSIITTSVTFITVLLASIFTWNFSLLVSMTGAMYLFLHLICPLLAIFIFFKIDCQKRIDYKDFLFPILFTIAYTLMIEIVHWCGGRIPYAADMKPPVEFSGWMILLFGSIETGLTTGLCFLYRYLHKRFFSIK